MRTRCATSGAIPSGLHCADCDITYQDPLPSHFSFNSPLGACETCKGFGRVIGIDAGLVIPDHGRSLGDGAIKPWQTATGKECQDDMERHAPGAGIPMDVPCNKLNGGAAALGVAGRRQEGPQALVWGQGVLSNTWSARPTRCTCAVLLSRYRSYTECTACKSARLKPQSLLWRLSGHNFHDLALLPAHRCRKVFAQLRLPSPFTEADDLLLAEVRARLGYLCDVGLGLPVTGSPVAHAVGRRGATHQPDHGAGHVAGKHAVRARRALHWAASARHVARDWRDAPAARCWQHLAGGGARSTDHGRGRSHHRHGTGRGRARRRHCVQWTGAGDHPLRRIVHRGLSGRPSSIIDARKAQQHATRRAGIRRAKAHAHRRQPAQRGGRHA